MGRGRPRAIPEFLYDGLRKMFPRLSHWQRWYALAVINALKDLPCFCYYYDANTDRAKISVLAELGRLGDEEFIRQVGVEATRVAGEQKLTVKEMERLLRQYRLGLQKSG